MGKVKIVTDSTAYLTDKQKEELEIAVVPLAVNFGNESFLEGEGYSNQEFYRKLRQGGFPTTSQPSVGDFESAYLRAAEGADCLLSVHLTAGLSGTLLSARTAAEMLPHLDITVVDSLSTSAGLALPVLEAARLARDGAGREEVLELLQGMIGSMRLLFVVDTLEYLQRGGRIGGAQALLGSILQVKPILTVKGSVSVFEKVRTKGKALARAKEEMLSFLEGKPLPEVRVALIHVDAREEALRISAGLQERFPGLAWEPWEIGPVVGAHVGPGTIGFAFCKV